jgi:hypothetical protein
MTAEKTPAAGQPRGDRTGDIRVRLYRNPLRLATSASTWRSAWFLLGYLVIGWLLFGAVFAALMATAILAITLAGLPFLVAAAAVIRGCASAERWRLRVMLAQPLHGGYRSVPRPGILARIRTHWRDPAIWRDIAYLCGLFAPLWVLDYAVFVIWAAFLAGIALPIWYWAAKNTCIGYCAGPEPRGVPFGYFPHGPHGHGATGLYVDTLPKALLAAAAFLILFLIFNYVLVLTAGMHARVARTLLSPPSDPLAEAREVLSRAGPLPPLAGEGAGRPRGPWPPEVPRPD